MRYAHNPILSPEDLCPSQPSMQIECLLNPGVFRYDGKVWMLVRVAERPAQAEGEISFPVLDAQNRVTVMRVPAASPELDLSDPRVINYKGEDFLTTMSHLRLVSSTDGIRFREEAGYPPLTGSDRYEAYGIEDCRVTQISTQYYLTYTAVSANGVAVRMRSTSDWRRFTDYGLVLPPHNKDCTLFDEKVGDLFFKAESRTYEIHILRRECRNLFDNFPEAFDASVEVERREVVPEPSPFYDALHDDLTRTLPVELRQVIVPK